MAWSRRAYLAASASAAVGLAGCSQTPGNGNGNASGNGGGNPSGDGEVVFLTDDSSPSWREFYTKTANKFTQETGIPVTFEYTGLGAGLEERLVTLVQSGSPPTMFMSFPTQEGGQLYAQGMLEPVDDVMADIESEYGKLSESWKFKPGGKNHEVITNFLLWHDWYRTDVYGSIPGTWDELLNAASNVDTEKTRAAIVAAKTTGLSGSQLLSNGAAMGADVVKSDGGDGKFMMEEHRDKWVKTLQFHKDLHAYSNTNADVSYGGASSSFGNGAAAYMSYPGSRPALIATQENPNLVENISDASMLSPDGNPRMSSIPLLEGIFILNSETAGAKAVENAKKFLRYIFLDDMSRYVDWMNNDPLHNLPPYPKVLESDTYQKSKPFQETPELKKWLDNQMANLLPNAKAGNVIGQANPWYGPISASHGPAEMMNDILIGGKSPAKAFDDNVGTCKEAFEETKQQLSE